MRQFCEIGSRAKIERWSRPVSVNTCVSKMDDAFADAVEEMTEEKWTYK